MCETDSHRPTRNRTELTSCIRPVIDALGMHACTYKLHTCMHTTYNITMHQTHPSFRPPSLTCVYRLVPPGRPEGGGVGRRSSGGHNGSRNGGHSCSGSHQCRRILQHIHHQRRARQNEHFQLQLRCLAKVRILVGYINRTTWAIDGGRFLVSLF